MPTTPSEDLTTKLKDKFLKIRGIPRFAPNSSSVETAHQKMFSQIAEYIQNKDTRENAVDDLKNIRISGNRYHGDWQEQHEKAIKDYRSVCAMYQRLVDEENIANRTDRRTKWRVFFFRVLTTLTLGFCIMFLYCLADQWDIPMPMLRL